MRTQDLLAMTEGLPSLIDQFAGADVLVIGDAILDTYVGGTTGRLTEEAPVPVVDVERREHVAGGAANVAVNVRALGGRPQLLSVIGNDANAEHLRRAITEHGIATEHLITEPGRPTPTETRIVADSQLVARVDEGPAGAISPATERALIERLRAIPGSADAAIVSDSGHGTLTPRVIEALVDLRAGSPRLVIASPVDASAYRLAGMTAIRIDYADAARLLGLPDAPPEKQPERRLSAHAERLHQETGSDIIVVMLDHESTLVLERGRVAYRTYPRAPRRGRSTGTADTFVSAFTLSLAAKSDIPKAAELASAATAVAGARDGTATCSSFELREFLSAEQKSVALDRLVARVDFHRRQGKRIVLTSGSFDILHRGHVTYLNRAKALGDVLVVGVNSDKSVAKLKGRGRPIIPLQDRIELLSALSCVDLIVSFNEESPIKLIRAIRPHVFAKGGDFTRDTLPEAPVVEELGGVVHILPLVEDRSTTGVIERVRRSGGAGPQRSMDRAEARATRVP